MAHFKYLAKTADGQAVNGIMESDTLLTLRNVLREKDLYLISGTAQNEKGTKTSSSKRLGAKSLSVICKQLASMLAAGVTLIRAMDILYQQTEDKRLKGILRKIYEEIQKGDQLSDALKKQGNTFPPLMISIIESGEVSGNLEGVIEKLANQFEGDNKINAKIRGALVYPIVLLVMVVAAVIVMLTAVLPTFVAMFDESGTELPAPTKIVMGASDFLIVNWYYIVTVIIIATVLLRQAVKTKKGRFIKDNMLLNVPILKKALLNIASSRFARTLANLVGSGLPLINGLEITTRVVNNAVIEEKLMEMREDVRTGMSLSYGIKKISVFPPIVHSMIAIGEESGDLDNLLNKLSDYMDDEVEESITRVMSMMEPIIIVVMGVSIGFIVIAMILPVFGVYETIQ
ncbi:MAG: type II secretion system F family protein [Clostridiales bacterium]|jgi:type IV pilus assembly protein PilC|nr:type II secretion system F family protein [Clostridiales bacterium]